MKDTSVPFGKNVKLTGTYKHKQIALDCYSKDDGDGFPSSGRVGPLQLADVHRCVQHAMDRYSK